MRTHLEALREEEATILRMLDFARIIKIVTPEGTVTDLSLDAEPYKERLVKVRKEIEAALEQRRRDADYDWYSNH